MAWKFKRYRIKWNKKKRTFVKKKVDRNRSRKARLRWRKNRAKMRAGLRKARRKAKRTMKRNKAAGMYRKLKVARKRYKSVLKQDVDMDLFISSILNENNSSIPELELDQDIDLDDMIDTLKDIQVDLKDEEEYKDSVQEFVEDAIKVLTDLKSRDPDGFDEEDLDMLHDIIDVIEEYYGLEDEDE
jgi:uncharacterized protein YaaR (DUF327 family)